MGFYYTSLLSTIPLAIAYAVLGLVYWGIVRATRAARWRRTVLSAIGVVFLLLPISEELWIAWNFGQACKEAGTFIYKKVRVDGFYDDTRTTHAGMPTPQAVESFEHSGFRFLEMRGREKFVRLEKIDGQWKPIVLDRPTARYHYTKPYSHTSVGHKIKMFEYLVRDTQAGEVLARERTYAREAPWYFVSLDRPTLFCPVSGRYGEKIHATIYDLVLQPLLPH
jgi:hypothetical protein